MRLASSIKSAFSALLANKIRTSLTVLGMMIGIMSVVIVFSAGEGIESLVLGQIESYGTDSIVVEVRVPSNKQGAAKDNESARAMVSGVQITSLNLDDFEDINKLPNISGGYAAVMTQERVSYGNEYDNAVVYGISAGFIDIDKSEIEFGRFFSEQEDKSLSEVIVLGFKIKDKLFGSSDAIGKSVTMNKSRYRVIGVLAERGAVMGMDFDEFAYVPVRTLQKKVMGIDHVSYTLHKLESIDDAEETAEEMRMLLREKHDIRIVQDEKTGQYDTSLDDFRVTTMTEMMEMLGTITNALTLLLLAIVAISLVVGGVGIMNIMYVVVTERTSEIGLRKAVGAKYSDIMTQFLVESVIITILGGIVGVIVGSGISYLIAYIATRNGFDWKFILPLKSFVVAFGFSCFFGIAFGLYPARKAAKMTPVEALRNE